MNAWKSYAVMGASAVLIAYAMSSAYKSSLRVQAACYKAAGSNADAIKECRK